MKGIESAYNNKKNKVIPGNLYRYDDNLERQDVDIMKEIIGYHTVANHIKNKEFHKQQLRDAETGLRTVFTTLGIEYKGKNLNALKTMIKELNEKYHLLDKKESYQSFVKDSNGFIVSPKFIEKDVVIISNISIPEDIDNGYYKYIDNVLVLDEVAYSDFHTVR